MKLKKISIFAKGEKFYTNYEDLVKLNPNKHFILRPHPFEDVNDYTELTNKLKNLHLDTSKTSIKALHKSKILIRDCTTGIEAHFLNIPTLTLNWLIEEKDEIFSLGSKMGYKANNLEEANNFINNFQALSNKNQEDDFSLKELDNFFGSKSINTLSIISECILEELKNFINIKKKFNFNLGLKTYLKVLLYKFLPISFYNFLLKIYLGKKIFESRKAKSFNENDIQEEILDKIILKKVERTFYILKK